MEINAMIYSTPREAQKFKFTFGPGQLGCQSKVKYEYLDLFMDFATIFNGFIHGETIEGDAMIRFYIGSYYSCQVDEQIIRFTYDEFNKFTVEITRSDDKDFCYSFKCDSRGMIDISGIKVHISVLATKHAPKVRNKLGTTFLIADEVINMFMACYNMIEPDSYVADIAEEIYDKVGKKFGYIRFLYDAIIVSQKCDILFITDQDERNSDNDEGKSSLDLYLNLIKTIKAVFKSASIEFEGGICILNTPGEDIPDRFVEADYLCGTHFIDKNLMDLDGHINTDAAITVDNNGNTNILENPEIPLNISNKIEEITGYAIKVYEDDFDINEVPDEYKDIVKDLVDNIKISEDDGTPVIGLGIAFNPKIGKFVALTKNNIEDLRNQGLISEDAYKTMMNVESQIQDMVQDEYLDDEESDEDEEEDI